MKTISLFFEHVPEYSYKFSFSIFFKELKNYNKTFIALTPKACFQLDKLDIKNYEIPEDYYWPKSLSLDFLSDIKEVKDVNFPVRPFMINFLESRLTKNNWLSFVRKYKEQINPKKIYYFGNTFELLIEACEETFDEFERMD